MPTIFFPDDLVLLTDDIRSWIVRIEDISLLEARQNFALVHFRDGKLLIRRSLGACERKLNSSTFFAPAGFLSFNLSHVKRSLPSKMNASFFC